ncbi:hypothetical protein PsYK624_160540 [Phanerochaete sordida]|uniref:Uncharacterized protein n=1 Tax=Phanerochaete sordida TaxID=48140 RepID=A0A9P3GQ32_9APHY|nr:hypothetical protein PsYK624_160540 [Phanerochaete sordida]
MASIAGAYAAAFPSYESRTPLTGSLKDDLTPVEGCMIARWLVLSFLDATEGRGLERARQQLLARNVEFRGRVDCSSALAELAAWRLYDPQFEDADCREAAFELVLRFAAMRDEAVSHVRWIDALFTQAFEIARPAVLERICAAQQTVADRGLMFPLQALSDAELHAVVNTVQTQRPVTRLAKFLHARSHLTTSIPIAFYPIDNVLLRTNAYSAPGSSEDQERALVEDRLSGHLTPPSLDLDYPLPTIDEFLLGLYSVQWPSTTRRSAVTLRRHAAPVEQLDTTRRSAVTLRRHAALIEELDRQSIGEAWVREPTRHQEPSQDRTLPRSSSLPSLLTISDMSSEIDSSDDLLETAREGSAAVPGGGGSPLRQSHGPSVANLIGMGGIRLSATPVVTRPSDVARLISTQIRSERQAHVPADSSRSPSPQPEVDAIEGRDQQIARATLANIRASLAGVARRIRHAGFL